MRIGIFGSSGFIGSNLVSNLGKKYDLVCFTRGELSLPIEQLAEMISKCAVVINLVGSPILTRWTDAGMQRIRESRIKVTNKIVSAATLAEVSPNLLINGSAIGIYKPGLVHDEYSHEFDSGFLGILIKEWEREALKARDKRIRTVILRTGVVLGKNGGMLKSVLPIFKLGFGGAIGSGKSDFSFIGIHDYSRAVEFIIENEHMDGVYNLTAPYPTTNELFTQEVAKSLKKRAGFRVPPIMIKMIYGKGADVLLYGQKVFPKRLMKDGFTFDFATIADVIGSELV